MFDRLTDRQWKSVSHLFPCGTKQRFGHPRRHPRDVLDAILWATLNGEKWHHLPAQYPPGQTCYIKSLQWLRDRLLPAIAGEQRRLPSRLSLFEKVLQADIQHASQDRRPVV